MRGSRALLVVGRICSNIHAKLFLPNKISRIGEIWQMRAAGGRVNVSVVADADLVVDRPIWRKWLQTKCLSVVAK